MVYAFASIISQVKFKAPGSSQGQQKNLLLLLQKANFATIGHLV